MSINDNIQYLKGVGESRAKLFHKLGVDTVGALLSFFPRNYEDWSNAFSISDAPLNTNCCVKAYLLKPMKEIFIRKGMTLYKCTFTNGEDILYATIFNNKYLASKIDTDGEYLLFGRITKRDGFRDINLSDIAKADFSSQNSGLRPIYRQTEKLNSKAIAKFVGTAIDKYIADIPDIIPYNIRMEHELCTKEYAIRNIHFPEDNNALEIAKKRLIFEEVLVLSLGMMKLKGRNKELTGTRITNNYTDEFIKILPFTLTNAQKKAIDEAFCDLQGKQPMNRLLQGDVGSGKTAVAAAICVNIIKNGYQTAFMAPTEILAMQHYRSLKNLLSDTGVRVMVLTGSCTAKEKKEIYTLAEAGEIDLLIGTHALIQDKVKFASLGLVITDEQHRFGVEQRTKLSKKGVNPHIYVMSATPIPRTLGLIIYGDLDISILDEMPAGRQKIDTYSVTTHYRERIYNFIIKHINEGRQAYIVCPMVDNEDGSASEMDLTSAAEYRDKLQNCEFKNYRVGLLNGKMKAAEKDSVMREFAQGKIDLLVATTVVEVGVDVPNATVMVVENSERFGLSTLHQLRGRVGRGEHKSYCILISDTENENSKHRLSVLTETNDGFKIADEDLKMRGPGDFFGSRQHGLPNLKIANFYSDMAVLKKTGKIAEKIIKKDPRLENAENALLKEAVDSMFSENIGLQ